MSMTGAKTYTVIHTTMPWSLSVTRRNEMIWLFPKLFKERFYLGLCLIPTSQSHSSRSSQKLRMLHAICFSPEAHTGNDWRVSWCSNLASLDWPCMSAERTKYFKWKGGADDRENIPSMTLSTSRYSHPTSCNWSCSEPHFAHTMQMSDSNRTTDSSLIHSEQSGWLADLTSLQVKHDSHVSPKWFSWIFLCTGTFIGNFFVFFFQWKGQNVQ